MANGRYTGIPAEAATPTDVAASIEAADVVDDAQTDAKIAAAVAALGATYAPLEMSEDFAAYPDGDLTNASGGQPWLTTFATPEAEPVIVGGRLTFADAAGFGGYAAVRLAAPVRCLGAAWAFSPKTVDGGSMAMAALNKQIGTGTLGPVSIHLRIEPTLWALGVAADGATAIVDLMIGTFVAPLATDGITVHEAEVRIDRANGFVWVLLPDGSIHKSPQDDRFKGACDYPFWEPYRDVATGTVGIANKTKPLISRVWASSREVDSALVFRSLEKAARNVAVVNSAGLSADVAFTTSNVLISSLVANAPTPSTGRFLVEITASIDVTVDGEFRLNLCSDAGTVLTYRTIATKTTHSGPFTASMIYTSALSPGRNQTFKFGIQKISGTGVLSLSNSGSINQNVIVKVTPA